MIEPRSSLPPSYFDEMYAANPDPWSFETSPYEAAKYAATIAALPRERYRHALEIGCSIGVLTEQLATRTDKQLSIDVSERALARARERCRHLPHVRFEQRGVPAGFPSGSFDLILVSEVGYYLDLPDLRVLQQQIVAALAPGGHLVLVHWTPFVDEYPLTGDQVHELFLDTAGEDLRHLHGGREDSYRLDVFERR